MVAFLQVFKHLKGSNGWRNSSVALEKPSSKFLKIFGSSAAAGWLDTGQGTLGHQHPLFVCFQSSLPVSHQQLQAQHCPPLLLTGTICPQGPSSGFAPFSAHVPVFTLCFTASHTEHSHRWCRYLMAAQKASHSRLSIDHHLWALQFPLLLSCELFQATLINLLLFLLSPQVTTSFSGTGRWLKLIWDF